MTPRFLPLEGRTIGEAIADATAAGYRLQHVTGEIVECFGGAIITAELTDDHDTPCLIETRQILPELRACPGDSRTRHEATAHPYRVAWASAA